MPWPARSRKRPRSTSCWWAISTGSWRRIFTEFARRARTRDSSAVDFKFQNIPFALNILDSLAGDDRFIDLRKRTRSHRILTKIEEATEEQRKATLDEQAKFFNEAQAANRRGAGRIPQEDGRPGKADRTWTRG